MMVSDSNHLGGKFAEAAPSFYVPYPYSNWDWVGLATGREKILGKLIFCSDLV